MAAIATNKKAYHNYFLSDKWECGIELHGAEVKSCRAGEVAFKDCYVGINKGEVWVHNLHIAPYTQASYLNTESDRARRLLLHKKEIKRITGYLNEKGGTIVPTKVYINSRGLVKVEIAMATGKKLFDKRDTIKKRDVDREVARELKRR